MVAWAKVRLRSSPSRASPLPHELPIGAVPACPLERLTRTRGDRRCRDFGRGLLSPEASSTVVERALPLSPRLCLVMGWQVHSCRSAWSTRRPSSGEVQRLFA
jgi:hypothetical protein